VPVNRDRIVQAGSLVVALVCVTAGGLMLPGILRQSESKSLRYTDISVEGAPPFVALGTAIGALRGLIVDYLWIKVNLMKEKGLFYEVMHDAELITKLQPRFPQVWAFHGHNMAYNISVATHTLAERWEWVNAGIRLVRNQGLRHNPNDLMLHRELGFWLSHKVDGVSDDANLYYKTEFAKEFNDLLGEPPAGWDDRLKWIEFIADAPPTLAAAEQRTPGVKALVDTLRERIKEIDGKDRFSLDQEFLRDYAMWRSLQAHSYVAKELGLTDTFRQNPNYVSFNEIAGDPQYAPAWETLLAHVRHRVLEDEYNMDPELMAQYTRDLGPLDWRHPQSHALYWSRRGSKFAEHRISREDVHKRMNNDRTQIQALQGLARSGRITFDPFSNEVPGRFPEPAYIDTIYDMFEDFYVKYYDVKGAGGETFLDFLRNFMGSAIREAYRGGERARAQELLDRLDALIGRGSITPNNEYAMPLDVYVRNETLGEYERQPHVAPSDIAASLRYGLRVGIGDDRPELYEEAKQFADEVTNFFKNNEYFDFETKFGTGRIKDIIGQLDQSVEVALMQLMTDPTVPMEERIAIWSGVDELEPELRLRIFDRLMPMVQQQFAQHPLASKIAMEAAFPPPAGLEQYRTRLAAELARQERQAAEAAAKDIDRK
jgi:hypothetical protein